LSGFLQAGPLTQDGDRAGYDLRDEVANHEHDDRGQEIGRVGHNLVPGVGKAVLQSGLGIVDRLRQVQSYSRRRRALCQNRKHTIQLLSVCWTEMGRRRLSELRSDARLTAIVKKSDL